MLVLLADRQLRWMQPVLLKTMSHSDGCMGRNFTEGGLGKLLLCVTPRRLHRAATRCACFVYAIGMDSNSMDSSNTIQLSGPFDIVDSLGGSWRINGIGIFDEGYRIIDVYVNVDQSMGDDGLHADPVVIRQILARLHALGYHGPDFGCGDPGLQDDHLIVLEAPEAFCGFAASKGWRDLAEDFADEAGADEESDDALTDPASQAVLSELMQRLSRKR